MAPLDPITGSGSDSGSRKGPPPPNDYGFTSFIPPGRLGWGPNHEVVRGDPGTKPTFYVDPCDLNFDPQLAVGGGRAVDALLGLTPIANNPPGSPGAPYIPAIFAPQPYDGPPPCDHLA